jgi:AGZA family xanthine/uracil permease-like MFS transporter
MGRDGNLPGINKVLLVDGLAVASGGATSSSATTCFVESTAGVGEGARTGLASVVTGASLSGCVSLIWVTQLSRFPAGL